MADLFGDTFSALTGQQSTPQQTIIPTNEALSQGYGALNSVAAPGMIAFNKQMAPAQAAYQLDYEKAINPYANDVRTGAYKSILDQLNLGTQLPPELQDEVVRNALQNNTASGFGLSQGGRGLVARDLGLTGLNLQNQRTQNAMNAAGGLSLTGAAYQPQNEFAAQYASGISQDIRGVQAQKDEYENLKEDIRKQNFSSLLNTGGRILGTVAGGIVGAYTGNVAGGMAAGGQIGGGLIKGSRVGGMEQQQQGNQGGGGGGMDYASILGGLFGNKGGGLVSGTGGTPDSVRAGSVGIFG